MFEDLQDAFNKFIEDNYTTTPYRLFGNDYVLNTDRTPIAPASITGSWIDVKLIDVLADRQVLSSGHGRFIEGFTRINIYSETKDEARKTLDILDTLFNEALLDDHPNIRIQFKNGRSNNVGRSNDTKKDFNKYEIVYFCDFVASSKSLNLTKFAILNLF
jgi:hypothetical protein